MGAAHDHSHATLLFTGSLGSAIGSLFAQSHPPDEILIVTDHNRELFDPRPAPWPEVRVVESTGPQRLPGARNTAVQECAAQVIEFLDDDADATPGWLAGAGA